MSKFTYKGINPAGVVVKGAIEASSKQGVIDTLKKQNIRPLSVSQSSTLSIGGFLNKKVKSKDISIFTRQLSTLISAGVPLNRSFYTLQDQTDNKYFRTVIGDIAKQVEGGTSIGDALKKYPDVFDEVYINMVIAGEAGGILDKILKRLATQLEKNQAIKKKVKSATTYPKVVFGITIIAFFVVMNVIVPKIGNMLIELGGPDAELPLLTQVMIGISDFSKQYAVFIIIAAFLGVAVAEIVRINF